MSNLPTNLKQAQEVWDEVEGNLAELTEKKTDHLHPVSEILLECVQAAVIEQFISDEYAPKDLFGSTM